MKYFYIATRISYKNFNNFYFGRLLFIAAYYIGEYANRQDYTTVNAYYLLIKKKIKIFSNIRKFNMEQLQSHI
jgi:hypothetical protein